MSHHRSQKAGRFSPSRAVRRSTRNIFNVFNKITDTATDLGRKGLQGVEMLGSKTSKYGKLALGESLSSVKALGSETRRGVRSLTRKLSPGSRNRMRASMKRRAMTGGSHQKKQLSLNSAVKLLRNYYSSKYSSSSSSSH